MQHDDLCHAAVLGGWHDPECCDCNLIAKARADERQRLASQSATVTVTRGDDGGLTFTADDPNGVGWVPVDLALIPQMAAQSRAVFDLRAKVQALPAWDPVSLGESYVKRADVLALFDGGGSDA